MGGVSGESSRDESIILFTDRAPDGTERLEAAVVWRHPQPAAPRSSRVALALALLALPWRMLMFAFERRRRRPPASSWHPPSGWSGSWAGNGERAVLLHGQHRLIRVAGEDYALPEPGRTLVLLVDEPTAGVDGATRPVTVRRHEATVAPQTLPHRDDADSPGSPSHRVHRERD